MNNSNKKKRDDDDAVADADNDDDAVDENQQRNKSHKNDHDICAICIDPLLPGEKIHTTECEHKFHTDCMVEYKSKSSKKLICPLCRADINAADIINSKPYVFNEQDFNSNPLIRRFRSNIAARAERANAERSAQMQLIIDEISTDDSDNDSEFRVGGRFCKSRRYRKSKKGRRKSIKRNSRRKSRRKRLVKHKN